MSRLVLRSGRIVTPKPFCHKDSDSVWFGIVPGERVPNRPSSFCSTLLWVSSFPCCFSSDLLPWPITALACSPRYYSMDDQLSIPSWTLCQESSSQVSRCDHTGRHADSMTDAL